MAKDDESKAAEEKISKQDQALIDAAAAAYGIGKEFILSANVRRDPAGGQLRAVIVTHGGSKIFYAAGDEKKEGFAPLTVVQVTGVNPNPKKRKPVAGKARS